MHEGVAIGDQVTLGDQSVIYPGVRIYPYKEVEYGAQIHESLIWESRGTTRLFGKDGVLGLVNVDLTPEVAVRFGAALGTALKRGARVVASRESAPAYRMIKRAIISGLHSTGVQVADLRTLPAPVGKHQLKTQGYDAAFHVGAASHDPEAVQIRLFERPGIALSAALQKEIDKHFTRQELRRVPFDEVGAITYPARARETLRQRPARQPRSRRDPRPRASGIVVDYGYSAASYVLPLVLGPLGVEAVTAHAFESDSGTCRRGCARRSSRRDAARAGGQRRLRRGLRPVGRADLPDRRARARGAARAGAAALPAPDRRERLPRHAWRSRSTRRARSRT